METDLQGLKIYLELEQVRLNDKFTYDIRIDDRIDKKKLQVPPLLLQPFIENAILHGLMHKKGRGRLKVTFKNLQSENISIEVEDDGIGRQKAAMYSSSKKKESMGLDISNKRLQALEIIFKKKASYTIVDLKNDQNSPIGTKVIILLPILGGVHR